MADDKMDFSTSEQEKECISDTKEAESNQEGEIEEDIDDSDDSSDSDESESEEITSLRQFVSEAVMKFR
jgi:hypothetical protein